MVLNLRLFSVSGVISGYFFAQVRITGSSVYPFRMLKMSPHVKAFVSARLSEFRMEKAKLEDERMRPATKPVTSESSSSDIIETPSM